MAVPVAGNGRFFYKNFNGAGVWCEYMRYYHRLISIAGIITAAVSALIVWQYQQPPADTVLAVTFLDVGQGDAILIETPSDRRILIDGGKPSGNVVRALSNVLPWYERTIDAIILTHPDDDHGGGLVEVARRYRVGRILYTGVVSDTASYNALIAEAQTERIPLTIIDQPQIIDLGDGARLHIVYPLASVAGQRAASLNDTSITARLVYGDISFLFTGDLEVAGEEALLASGQPVAADVLKIGHHGSDSSTSAAFITAVAPRYAVVSVGSDNDYGHPSLRVLRRLERAGAAIWRTDTQGSIEMRTDGTVLEVRGGRH